MRERPLRCSAAGRQSRWTVRELTFAILGGAIYGMFAASVFVAL